MVADGYKQTDIGVIPKDWKVKSISEVASIQTGSKNTQDKVSDGKYPFYVRSQTVENINSYSFDGEAVLTAGDGVGTGKVFHFINGKFDYHQRVYNIHEFKIEGSYFYQYFKTYFYDRVMAMTAKSSVDSVRKEMISEMLIPIPPKQEQQAIATVLSDTDELINSLEKLISKKEAIKTGTMQELLTGKRRLDGFSGEWEEKTLGDYVSITSGDSPSKFSFHDKGMPYYKVEQLNYSSKYLIENTPYFIENTAKRVTSNSIIFPKRGAAIFLNKIRLLASDAFFDTNLMALTTNDKLSHEFLFYVLDYIGLEHVADTTSVPQINNKHINPFVVPFPVLDEQLAIATILSDMDSDIDAFKTKLSKVKAIKEGMMQELLTGKTRLLEAKAS